MTSDTTTSKGTISQHNQLTKQALAAHNGVSYGKTCHAGVFSSLTLGRFLGSLLVFLFDKFSSHLPPPPQSRLYSAKRSAAQGGRISFILSLVAGVKRLTYTDTPMHTWTTFTRIHMYVFMYVFICPCTCSHVHNHMSSPSNTHTLDACV